MKQKLHQTIVKVGADIEELKFNTAVACLMEFLNAWQEKEKLSQEDAGSFLKLLAPLAPHLAEEIWCEILGNRFSVHQQEWPAADPEWLKEKMTTVIVQVSGRVRGEIKVQSEKGQAQNEIEELAKKEPRVAKYLESQPIKKVIFVPGKLINFVV